MTRANYIEALSGELLGFDEETKRDILLEIEDHIDELVATHPDLAEEAIVAGLEKPEVLAASLRAEAGLGDKPEGTKDREEPKHGRMKFTIDGKDIGSDLGDVIRKAMDIARIFKENPIFGKEGEREGSNEKSIHLDNIPSEKVKELVVKTASADVRILLSLDRLSIKAHGAEDSRLRTEFNDGRLEISSRAPGRDLDMLELKVPSSVAFLSVTTASGNVEVLDRIGHLQARTASGDIAIQACSGDVEAFTASGSIAVARCGENIRFETVSGDIDVELDEQCCGAAISTTSGDVNVQYPEDFDGDVNWSTISGSVDCDCDKTGNRRARIGAGLVPVQIRTLSGDISLTRMP
jgi:hypothetical protein